MIQGHGGNPVPGLAGFPGIKPQPIFEGIGQLTGPLVPLLPGKPEILPVGRVPVNKADLIGVKIHRSLHEGLKQEVVVGTEFRV
jgi:hypothetical protein